MTTFTSAKADQWIKDTFPGLPPQPLRPAHHVSAPVGWINDPNGLVFFRGEYHVFYQYYPYDTEWGPMHWGHAKSPDLLHWEHLPVALVPEHDYEAGGCFSGSAVVKDDTLYLFYTGHNEDNSPKEVQCGAYSTDGIQFTKMTQNPIISSPPKGASEDFRDPKVIYKNGKWLLVIGTSFDDLGSAVYYSSQDLTSWTYEGVLLQGTSGEGTMWECVDFFELDGKDVLLSSPMGVPGSKTKWRTGRFESGTFHVEEEGEIDDGPDFYAPQTFSDDKGRRLMIGWMNMWERTMAEKPEGWAGALTMPRELGVVNGHLIQQPPAEWEAASDTLAAPGPVCLLEKTAHPGDEWTLQNRDSVLHFSLRSDCLLVDRSNMALGDQDTVSIPVSIYEKGLVINMYLDHSCMEIFFDQGRCASLRTYFSSHDFTAEGVDQIRSLKNI
ncbi:glycoside hydrolase family 32 protein [Alkalicoccus saliphilus]|uniref:beta-fructofuranosidase n=1 Tax=Alkalicoccus saliphilus TaxID=200989 RepID=A0A2T4U6S1_9BACI|nr:glycoside hydrolase family 32 protein [Alkalicoccus saliphilus]PTL39091.1 hypothetical protein C6Y45_07890 [Alkalicoccus saliphilus]